MYLEYKGMNNYHTWCNTITQYDLVYNEFGITCHRVGGVIVQFTCPAPRSGLDYYTGGPYRYKIIKIELLLSF